MDIAKVPDRIAEYAATRGDAGADIVRQVEAALFVEEVFGLELTDADICESCLGTHQAMKQLVLDRLGPLK